MSVIAENLLEIKENIAAAAKKSGRKPEDILLVGVTKTVDTTRIAELLSLGVKDLGENRVQEILEKYPVLADWQPNWHMIGHLQTNKVKMITDKVCMIHSVESLKLAEEIDRRAGELGKVMDILLEVNAADEMSKFGLKIRELPTFVENLCKYKHIRVRGLMTVAPFVDDPTKNRKIFQMLRQLSVDIQGLFAHNINMTYLSMGMSNDYEVAIEEGANIVRIGTRVFGERKYT